MERTIGYKQKDEDYINIPLLLNRLETDLSLRVIELEGEKATQGRETILEVLTRAADDYKFLSRLANDPAKALKEYEHDMTWEQRAALASGDGQKIESWVGKLDKHLYTWIKCRLEQEKW